MSNFNNASLIVTPNSVKAGKLYAIKPTTGAGDLDVVRATTAAYVGADGLIKTALANVPRLDYTNGSCPSILVEPQRTNLVFPSATATTQTRTVTATAHTLSFYGTGSVTLSGVATGTLVGTGTNNRVTLTFTPTAGSLILTVSGSVTNWQLEEGSNATSYIPTTTTSVTRNADVISKTGISDLIGQTEGSIYCEFISNDDKNWNTSIFSVNSSNGNERIQIRYNNVPTSPSGGYLNLNIRANLVIVVNVSAGTLIPIKGQRYKVCATYNQTEQKIYVNGVLVATRIGSYTQPGTMNSVQLGGIAGNQFISNTSFNSALVFKNVLSDAEAIQLTTL